MVVYLSTATTTMRAGPSSRHSMPPETFYLVAIDRAVNRIKNLYGTTAAGSSIAEGTLYGTTYCNGRYTAGTVFKLTPSNGSWVYSLLHEFTNGADGGLSVQHCDPGLRRKCLRHHHASRRQFR